MENQELHAQKVTILSRLIKENYLSLEEALLLLKDEEPKQASVQFLTSGSGTVYKPSLGNWSTTTNYPSFLSMGTTGTTTIRSSGITNEAVDDSADLNN
jgi:hypothetical protein